MSLCIFREYGFIRQGYFRLKFDAYGDMVAVVVVVFCYILVILGFEIECRMLEEEKMGSLVFVEKPEYSRQEIMPFAIVSWHENKRTRDLR